MKTTDLKKDSVASIRINSKVKAALKELGQSPQSIIDHYLDLHFPVSVVFDEKFDDVGPAKKKKKTR